MTPERRAQIEAIKKAFLPIYGPAIVEFNDDDELIFATVEDGVFTCEIGSDDDTLLFVFDDDHHVTVEVRWPLDLQDTFA